MELISYGEFGRAARLANDRLEVVVTLDIGPRIIRLARPGGENILAEDAPVAEPVGAPLEDGTWRIYGGHRVWHSPEAYPRSYVPDDTPVERYEELDGGIRIFQKEEPWVQMAKSLEVRLLEDRVRVVSTLTNRGAWPVELAVWSLTVGSRGGRLAVPVTQRNTGLLANRHVVMWPDSRMNDPRVYWGQRYTIVTSDPEVSDPFKFGYPDEYGWAAYFNHGECFIKKFEHRRGAAYPDFGCSWEAYTAEWGMELESLSPLTLLAPGNSLSHTDEWFLFAGVSRPDVDEDAVAEALAPLAGPAGIRPPVVDYRGWKNPDPDE
jgi:hypothetical protein